MAQANGKKKTTIEEAKKHILNVATKSPLLGRELGEKLDKKYKDRGYADARSFGRALSALVDDGKITKSGPKSRPKYAKA